MTNKNYPVHARTLVLWYINQRRAESNLEGLTLANVYLVWFAKTLQNWKALISTDTPDGMYYEVTFNGDKKEVYIDAYGKLDNVVVPMKDDETAFDRLTMSAEFSFADNVSNDANSNPGT